MPDRTPRPTPPTLTTLTTPAAPQLPAWADEARTRRVLGPYADDACLRTVLDLVMGSPAAMAYLHGPEHRLLYNEAWASLLGAKHPFAYGCPAAEVFDEAWDLPGIGEVVSRVYRTGEPYYEADTVLPVPRPATAAEQPTFTRAYSVVRAGDGEVAGMLTVAVETTQTVSAIHRLGRLAAELSEALTVDDVAKAALRHAVRDLGLGYARLALAQPSGAWSTVRLVADDLSDPATERLPLLWRDLPPHVARPGTGGTAADWSGLRVDQAATDVLLEWLGPSADHVDRQVRATAVYPIGGDEPLGAFLVYGWLGDDERHQADRMLLDGCADLVARALRRARAVDRERSAAQMLQRSLLPDTLPQSPAVLLAARYEPGAGSQSVGGDFYDAFEVSEGRLALVVGDAMGQGVLAASVMGQVRAAIRAVALTDPAPGHVLDTCSRLFESVAASNDALASGHFVTATYVLLDPADGRACAASAGHLPPLLRARPEAGDGGRTAARFLEMEVGPPLGIDGARPAEDFVLDVGEALVLVTDGLIERRGTSLTEGMADLQATVAAFPGNDPMLLATELLGRYGPHTSDDVAVLAAARTAGVFRSARTVLPADPVAVRIGRHWATQQLEAWGVRTRLDDVEAALTEVISNAVLHARTSADVSLRHGDGQLLVTISDHGAAGDAERQVVPGDSTRGRGLTIVDALTDAWGTQRTTSGQRVWFEVATS